MRWITRQNIKVDRVTCPWLIKRFIDLRTHRLYTLGQEEDGRPVARMVVYDAVKKP